MSIKKSILCSLVILSSVQGGVGDYINTNQATSIIKNQVPQASTVLDGISNVQNISQTLSSGQTSEIITNIFGGLGVTDSFFIQPIKIPGVAGLNIQCDFPKNASGRSFDICEDVVGKAEDGIIGGINDVLDVLNVGDKTTSKINSFLNNGLSVGPCKVGVEIRKTCQTDLFEESCKTVRSTTAEVAGAITDIVMASPLQSVVGSAEELMQFGDRLTKAYFEDMVPDECAAILPKERMKAVTIGKKKTPLSDFYDDQFSAKNISQKALQKAGVSNITAPELYDWKQCVLLNPDNPDICDISNMRLPADYKAVQKEVQTTKVALSDGLEKTNTFEKVVLLSNNYLTQCKTGEAQSDCEERIYNDGYTVANEDGTTSIVKLKDVKERQHEEVERSVIYYANILNAIKNQDAYYDFMTEDVAENIPLEKRNQFRRKALLEMKKRSLHGYFIDKIMYSKKEIVDLEHNLIKVSSTQFNAQEALQEVEALIASFEAM